MANEFRTEAEALKKIILDVPPEVTPAEAIERWNILQRLAILPPYYDPEVIQLLCFHFGQHPAEGSAYKSAVSNLRSQARKQSRKTQKEETAITRETYFTLFKQILGPLPRDLFSGRCMMKLEGLWEPAINHIDLVKSEILDLIDGGFDQLKVSAVDIHYHAFQHEQPAVFIPEVPEWDGVDRITACAQACVLDGSQEFSQSMVEAYFKGWLAGIFYKLKDPRYQNPALILRSEEQGIGKDSLVNTMTDGFEQWAKNMNITNNDRDNYIQLSHAAILKISEFDRTSKAEVSTLKDMIFRDTTYLRASHAREEKDRYCKASFVATVNPDDFYRDATGHRRYAVFNLKSIRWDYPNTRADSKQILAQAKHLADSGYKIPPIFIQAMAAFLKTKTPETPESITEEKWEHESKLYLDSLSVDSELRREVLKRRWMTNQEINMSGIFDKITKSTGLHLRTVRQHLKTLGLGERRRIGDEIHRGFKFTQKFVERMCHFGDSEATHEDSDDFL